MFDISMLDRCPPEPAGEPACRACTILLEPARPGRPLIELPNGLGAVCGSCYETMNRFMANGLTMPAALEVATWGAPDL